MFISVNFSLFCDQFAHMNRNNFSYEGKRALFDHLESIENDCDTKIELDVIALCCEFTEYAIEEALSAFDCEDLDELCDNCNVIMVDDETVIIGE